MFSPRTPSNPPPPESPPPSRIQTVIESPELDRAKSGAVALKGFFVFANFVLCLVSLSTVVGVVYVLSEFSYVFTGVMIAYIFPLIVFLLGLVALSCAGIYGTVREQQWMVLFQGLMLVVGLGLLSFYCMTVASLSTTFGVAVPFADSIAERFYIEFDLECCSEEEDANYTSLNLVNQKICSKTLDYNEDACDLGNLTDIVDDTMDSVFFGLMTFIGLILVVLCLSISITMNNDELKRPFKTVAAVPPKTAPPTKLNLYEVDGNSKKNVKSYYVERGVDFNAVDSPADSPESASL